MLATVTFVIAHYEAQATLPAAVESALAQTGVETEVVVVDDASPHGVPDTVRNHPSGRVILIERASNGGPGAARNDGFDAARGRWVAVLDSDDVVVPNRMQSMLKHATGADVLVDNVLIEDAREPRTKAAHMFAPGNWSRVGQIDLATFILANRLFAARHNFGYLKPVFSKAFIERHAIRYDPGLRIGEDYLFLASALALGAQCIAVPDAGYIYRIRDGSISRVLDGGHVDQMRRADRGFEDAFGQTFDERTRRALELRRHSLDRADAYLAIVEGIKAGRWLDTAGRAIRFPSAASLLRLPIMSRLSPPRWPKRAGAFARKAALR